MGSPVESGSHARHRSPGSVSKKQKGAPETETAPTPRPRGLANSTRPDAPLRERGSEYHFCSSRACRLRLVVSSRSRYRTHARRSSCRHSRTLRCGWLACLVGFSFGSFLSKSQNQRPNHIGPALSSIPAESACRHNGRPILGEISFVGLADPSTGCCLLAGIPRAVAALTARRTAPNQDSEAVTPGRRSP